VEIRVASRADLPALIEIDQAAFAGASAEPATPDELSSGVDNEQIIVAVISSTLVGYAQWTTIGTDAYFLSGVAVRPNDHGQGIGGQLLDACLKAIEILTDGRARTIEVTTAPDNVPMLKLLTRRGFVGTEYLAGYYGADRDRLYLRRYATSPRFDRNRRIIVPVHSRGLLRELLENESRFVRDIVHTPHGVCFEVVGDVEDEAATKANESNSSISFTGVFFTAIAFLAGFALVTEQFPADLLAVLIVSLVCLAFALIVYANSTGALSRIRAHEFDEYMRVGNIFSEFGGVYPFFHVVPVVLVSLGNASTAVGAITCFGATAALIAYHASRFEILERYLLKRRTRIAAEAYLSISPVLGFTSQELLNTTAAWSLVNVAVLLALTAVCLRRHEQ
jgi:ribosomal protein S18 acetylase RimI-like enzyme